MDGECSNMIQTHGFLGLTHSPREGPQFVLTPEVKVSWILWSWQRVFWSWVTLRRLSVEHYPCIPLSTSHDQKSVSLGSSHFFGRLRAYLIDGAHVAVLVIP